MTDQSNIPALQRSLADVVDEYEAKRAAIPQAIEAFGRAVTEIETASCIGGTYAGTIWGRGGHPSVHDRTLEDNLRKSAWRFVYNGLNINRVAPAKDRNRFEQSFENPPEFTIDNIRATFGKYLQEPRFHILRGLAEVFCDLDPAYKSHCKVKIGVEGLPKRVILSGFGEYSYGSWGQDKLLDMLNALANYTGREQLHQGQIFEMTREGRKHGSVMWWGGELRVFKNGNAHVHFDKPTLAEINRALAEFYGDVLPDAPREDDDPERAILRSREVSKDLAYYPTPRAVIDHILRDVRWQDVETVLEPSCGDGRILDVVRESAPTARTLGIEVHGKRAKGARAKGHHVLTGNFLTTAPDPKYDLIVMNPPFYGKHWQKHVMHARKFLKPAGENRRGGGTLICILPGSAFWDGHLGEIGLCSKDLHEQRGWQSFWHDLPTASFAESGTRIPTGYIEIGPSLTGDSS